ncbi:MAG: OmpH family outer membrane protein [Candidatus Kapaibacteriota bacterium]
MKHLFIAFTCIIASFFFVNSEMNAQTQKIGYVDTEVILKQLPEAQDADKKLKDIATKFQDTLVAMQKDLTEKIEQYKKQESMMTPDAKKKEEDMLKAIQQSMMQYQEEKFGNTGEIRRLQESFLTPIRDRILLTIKEVSKDEKFNFILDKVNPALLYADDKFDLTFKVLDKIRRNSK